MGFRNSVISVVAVAAVFAATPAAAVTNLLKNGSFEAGATGTGNFTNWVKTNVPNDAPASVISYDNTLGYPFGAFGENVFADNAVSASPDAVGTQAAYFVGDLSVNETISQLTYLRVGNYRLGFSYFLTANGLANVGNSSFEATIIGAPVAATAIINGAPGRVWQTVSGVGQITRAGYYLTSFVFNSNLAPSKDIVIDRAFAIQTNDPATIIIPPTPTAIPEPSTWAMLLIGFGFVGGAARRRKSVVAT